MEEYMIEIELKEKLKTLKNLETYKKLSPLHKEIVTSIYTEAFKSGCKTGYEACELDVEEEEYRRR